MGAINVENAVKRGFLKIKRVAMDKDDDQIAPLKE